MAIWALNYVPTPATHFVLWSYVAGGAVLFLSYLKLFRRQTMEMFCAIRGCVRYYDERVAHQATIFYFWVLQGGPSGSSCVASARLRGQGYFFFGHMGGVVARVVGAIIGFS